MPRRKLTAGERRTAEHTEFLKLLASMSKAMTAQTELLTRFMKSYEVTTPPSAYVQSEEREWMNEMQDKQVLAKEIAQTIDLPNPFSLMSMDDDG